MATLGTGHGQHGLVDGRSRQVEALLKVQMLEKRLLRVLVVMVVRVRHCLQGSSAIRLLIDEKVLTFAAAHEQVGSRCFSQATSVAIQIGHFVRRVLARLMTIFLVGGTSLEGCSLRVGSEGLHAERKQLSSAPILERWHDLCCLIEVMHLAVVEFTAGHCIHIIGTIVLILTKISHVFAGILNAVDLQTVPGAIVTVRIGLRVRVELLVFCNARIDGDANLLEHFLHVLELVSIRHFKMFLEKRLINFTVCFLNGRKLLLPEVTIMPLWTAFNDSH